MSSVSLTSRGGHFSTIDQFTECVRASMLVPGLAGPPLTMPTPTPPVAAEEAEAEKMSQDEKGRRKGVWGDRLSRRSSPSWALGDWWTQRRSRARGSAGRSSSDSVLGELAESANATTGAEAELLVDAMVFEPLPYRYVVAEGFSFRACVGIYEEWRRPSVGLLAWYYLYCGFLSFLFVCVSFLVVACVQRYPSAPVAVSFLCARCHISNGWRHSLANSFRSAVDDGCTDVVVLCTRPEGSQVLGKVSGRETHPKRTTATSAAAAISMSWCNGFCPFMFVTTIG